MPRDETEYAQAVERFREQHGAESVRITRTKRKPAKPKPSAEDVFAAAWAASGGPECVRQHRFDGERRWTFDFAWPRERVALELEGLGAGGGPGRHHLPAGIIADCEKFNAALLQGWRVLRVPSRGGRDAAQWVQLVTQALTTFGEGPQ